MERIQTYAEYRESWSQYHEEKLLRRYGNIKQQWPQDFVEEY